MFGPLKFDSKSARTLEDGSLVSKDGMKIGDFAHVSRSWKRKTDLALQIISME